MAARSDPIQNFCNKIKAYHEKREEEQFYDFTIKDKDGAEIKSHKFLLASQIEYFAALFRRDANKSETTFEDFSLDVIKKCIDFLYTHEINMIDCNVQDVLIFANYIDFPDVIDICTDFIIKNIDKSNCGHAINLGAAHGMDKLIEAGVLYAVRNFRQSLEDLDDLTKGNTSSLIAKLADRQKERVTIMTGDQWNINRLKTSLSAPTEENVFHARSSSIYQPGDSLHREPLLAVNGEIAPGCGNFFHSDLENHPWLEVKLASPVLISSVTIVNRQNGNRQRLRNLEVRAGMEPVPEGFTAHDRGLEGNKKLEVNSRCGYFAGPADNRSREEHVIMFDKPTLAEYITLQILAKEFLQINGIRINGGDLLDYRGYF